MRHVDDVPFIDTFSNGMSRFLTENSRLVRVAGGRAMAPTRSVHGGPSVPHHVVLDTPFSTVGLKINVLIFCFVCVCVCVRVSTSLPDCFGHLHWIRT